MRDVILQLWAYRHFIISSIRSEFSRRFVRSKFGALWFVIHPLIQATIFALVLSEMMAARLPGVANKSGFAIYLMAGMAAWGLFSEITTRCLTIFIDNASVLKKISFPKLCLPIIIGGSAILNHILLLLATATIFICMSHFPGFAWLVLPLIMFILVLFAFGLGLLLGVFNVFVRDVAQVYTVVIQIWFWLTPIVYTLDILPKKMFWLISINPIAPLVKAYQDVMLYDNFPIWNSLVYPLCVALSLFIISFITFRRASSDLIDEL